MVASIQRCLNMAPLCLSYQRLLQTIGVLEAQRTQAILDLEVLAHHQREALSNPIEFVEQLQKQVTAMHTCYSNDLFTVNWARFHCYHGTVGGVKTILFQKCLCYPFEQNAKRYSSGGLYCEPLQRSLHTGS